MPTPALVAGVAPASSLDKLKTWRRQRAQADQVAAYMIAHNTSLEALAAVPPTTPQQLLASPGFGSRKVEAYGADILALIADHQAELLKNS